MSDVFRLIYRSHSCVAAEDERSELGDIFTTARSNNKRLGVTGALVITGDAFAQALEGDEAVVRELYTRICGDAPPRRRHAARGGDRRGAGVRALGDGQGGR